MVGFVHFAASPRHVSLARAAQLATLLPAHVASVLVLVDPADALLAEIAANARIDYWQLHGGETPARIAEIRKQYPAQKLIKALPVARREDVLAAAAFEGVADMLLFDAKAPGGLPGGNGVAFDWKMLAGFQSALPWGLSGGLTVENVSEAVRISGAEMIDTSSGVEEKPGVKSHQKIAAFIAAARNASASNQ